jgi:integrase/recombinase XerD
MLRFESWSADDRAAWDRLFVDGGLFEATGRGCGWSTETVKRFRYCHSRWLGFLSDNHPAALQSRPHDRLSQDLIGECLARLSSDGLKRGTIASFLDGLVQLHAAFDPDLTPPWLRRLVRTLKAEAYAASDRPDYRISIDVIWHGALAALQALDASANRDIPSAIAYRDRLMLALLAFTLLRRKNLAQLELQSLTRSEDGWILTVEARAVKNHREIVRLLPSALGRHIDHYLDRFRPVLLGCRQSNSLWINYAGGPLRADDVAKAIKRTTRRMLGVTLTPHDLRRIAPTTIASDAPELIYLATQLLGHSSRVITERHYNRATSLSAGRRHADAMDERRQALDNEVMKERIRDEWRIDHHRMTRN